MTTAAEQWESISAKIAGLERSVSLLATTKNVGAATVVTDVIAELTTELGTFKAMSHRILPSTVLRSIDRVVEASRRAQGVSAVARVQGVSAALVALRAELDTTLATGFRLLGAVERAFLHLQRTLVADDEARRKWRNAFDEGTARCEALGGVHLLLHGVLGFKARAPGEEIDLALQQRLRVDEAIREAVVGAALTDWSVVRDRSTVATVIEASQRQLAPYRPGSLGGVPLSPIRYAVFVSDSHLEVPPDAPAAEGVIRCVSISVGS